MIIKQLVKLAFLFFLIFNSQLLFSNNTFSINKTPTWIQKVSYIANDSIENNEGFYYLLIDSQDNLSKKTYFRHYAIKVFNSDGIQSMSDIDISFDPAYQKLSLHELKIIREGKIINKILDSNIQTIQQESSAERLIYDGSLTTIINLKDIRENDIIEYSYSITGSNPINKESYSNTLYQQYVSPVNRVFNRIIFPKNIKLNLKLFNGAKEPKITVTKNLTEYIWDMNAEDFIIYDNNVPQWYNPQRRVALTTYNSWEEVVDWALPLYIDEKINTKNILQNNYSDSKKENIRRLIEFVQDDIRYLGFESGISAYKPHAPNQILNQRFGDCKDKSLLLISLLRQEGATAYPLLINTELSDQILNKLPAHNLFDHCIVYFEYDNETYIIDPTNTNQGGNIDNISFPNYSYGLLIKPEQKELIKLPRSTNASLDIVEKITLDSIGGSARLNVISTYSGNKADYIRSYFSSTKTETIQKEYLNFYSNLYANIEIVSPPIIINDDRENSNDIIIEENYLIPNLWLELEDSEIIYFETYPLVLESLIDFSNSSSRDMPYYLGTTHSFSQTTIIKLPEEWEIKDETIKISGDGYEYQNTITNNFRTVTVQHDYILKKEFISGNSVSNFSKKHDKIISELSYNFTYNKSLATHNTSWMAIILLLFVVSITFYYSIKIYKYFNPKPFENHRNLSIGGWLVLPAIGLTLSPIFLVYEFLDGDYFNKNIWANALTFDNSHWVILLVGFEFIYNIVFIIFSVLVLVLFYQRRTSVPKLISAFYIISFVVPLIDAIISYQLFSDELMGTYSTDVAKEIFRSFIAICIWVPYFNISKRVKNTFVNTF